MTARGVRGPQREDPEPFWIPVRYVKHRQECSFCGATIFKGSPGARVGERGTKAYWNRLTGEWECIACRNEAVRATLSRDEGPPLE